MSNFFFLWSTIENCWSTKVWSQRLHWGVKGEGGGGVTPYPRWGSGGSPAGNFLENCLKMVHSGAFEAVNTENLYEKNCVCLRKDFILDLDNKIFWFFFSNLLLYLNHKCCTPIQWPEYWSLLHCAHIHVPQLCLFHVYRSQMLIYQTFSFQNPLSSLNFSLIILTIASFRFSWRRARCWCQCW